MGALYDEKSFLPPRGIIQGPAVAEWNHLVIFAVNDEHRRINLLQTAAHGVDIVRHDARGNPAEALADQILKRGER